MHLMVYAFIFYKSYTDATANTLEQSGQEFFYMLGCNSYLFNIGL